MLQGRMWSAGLVLGLLGLSGCGELQDASNADQTGGKKQIVIDGSSTVLPISQAVAEEFEKLHPEVRVVVGRSGTGGGFKKFVLGEIDINNASRPIENTEIAKCRENKIEYVELTVAIDGLSVVVNTQNDWCPGLTVAQLKAIWEPNSKINKWSDLDAAWPNKTIKLYGPDTDSGTFDYFTEVICGESGASRSDYTPSADDNLLVRGVSGDKYSLGYFGYAYYAENKNELRALPIAVDAGSEFIAPTDQNIESGKYVPLSRPLFIYANRAECARKDVAEFLNFYMSDEGQKLVGEVGYVRLSEELIKEPRERLAAALVSEAAK
ncbi:MAG: PstS family phosphate ABC transporter substrate-binding protein [Planctomycetota bacterium]|nr:PstS family phosphate ABC transporter substrate-binding protein [Planctomycetota bacterium]